MMKHFIYVCLLFLIGCSRQVSLQEASITQVILLDDVTYQNAGMNIAAYRDHIYYMEDAGTDYRVHVLDSQGEQDSVITIPKGKGPGEMTHNWRLKIFDDLIYLLDTSQNKIVVYDLQGEPADDIYFDVTGERITDFVVLSDSIVLEGVFKNKLLKLDKETGDILAKLEYDKVYQSVNEYFSSELREGVLASHDGRIYLGYYNKPFRIDVFSVDLEQEKSIVKDYGEGYETCGWRRHPQGGVALMGHQMVYNMFVNGEEITVPFGQGITYDNEGMHFMDVENCVYVLGSESGETKRKIWSSLLPMTGAGYTVLNADEREILLFLMYDDEAVQAVLDKTQTPYEELPRGLIIRLAIE